MSMEDRESLFHTNETSHVELINAVMCINFIVEPSEDEVPGIPGRRVVGRNANFRAAAKIREGPTDSIVIRGFPISLCCVLRGSPPLRVTWTKSNQEVSIVAYHRHQNRLPAFSSFNPL